MQPRHTVQAVQVRVNDEISCRVKARAALCVNSVLDGSSLSYLPCLAHFAPGRAQEDT